MSYGGEYADESLSRTGEVGEFAESILRTKKQSHQNRMTLLVARLLLSETSDLRRLLPSRQWTQY